MKILQIYMMLIVFVSTLSFKADNTKEIAVNELIGNEHPIKEHYIKIALLKNNIFGAVCDSRPVVNLINYYE